MVINMAFTKLAEFDYLWVRKIAFHYYLGGVYDRQWRVEEARVKQFKGNNYDSELCHRIQAYNTERQ